ncbi:N-acetyllactosaminide beta-1,6-N-acetylglucosaminyl-transferase-like [Octopus sinensis]|uniref:N-acetyllactosaminide beta-1,6-N-acetylglucosaminyl-transferase-like n=1 Tax=Octopus sinensis TaxID=2607531 RepID=A0A6P7SUT1_9MOLL|nr:N-acetyllactosaminide beta-1,6-N-acetylglucosaminyl-transferase-like [Octopus sinensis]
MKLSLCSHGLSLKLRLCLPRNRFIFIVLLVCLIFTYFVSIKYLYLGTINNVLHADTSRHPFDCAALIRQDEFALSNAENYSALHPHVSLPNGEYAKNLCQNCDEFRKRGRYITLKEVTKEEEDFPLAYSIVLYKEPDQVENLLRAIYRPHNYYCIHVDNSSDPLILSDMEAIAKCLPNVYIASRIIDVEWGIFSQTEAELICMRDLLKYKKWKYFINLTGQEYPLKTNLQIVRILKALKGANDIEGIRDKSFEFRTKYHYVKFQQMGLKPPPPHNITVSKGSVHIAASRGYVEFLIMDRRSQDFTNWVRDTRNPDETLFSTMNHNPHLRVPGSFNGTEIRKKRLISRFKLWQFETSNCHGKWLRTVCVFGHGDLKQLTNSSKLFANKFEQRFMPMTLRCLSEWHYNRTRDEYNRKYVFSAKAYEQMLEVLLRIQ